jgi:hypothetical protein
MKQIKRIFYLLLLSSIRHQFVNGQETIPASGGIASGNGGTAAYTVGQLFFNVITGSTGFIIQGVQQPYEISIVTAIENTADITLECLVYPNPTAGSIKLVIGSFEDDNMRFRLYNLNGVLLQNNKIEDKETAISMDDLLSGIYLLKVINDKMEVKVFKIIKK